MNDQSTTAVVDAVSTTQLEVLNATEAAALLRVSKPVIYGMVNDKPGFPFRKVGNKLRFSRRALIAWLERTA